MARCSPDWRQAGPQKSISQLIREKVGYASTDFLMAVAGGTPRLQILNPVGSGILAWIYQLDVSCNVAASIAVSNSQGIYPGHAVSNYNLYSGGPTGLVSNAASEIAGVMFPEIGQFSVPVMFSTTYKPMGVYLDEGTTLTISSDQVNSIIVGTFSWFELVEF